jgi:polar amino acid transport system substrate-binding protein
MSRSLRVKVLSLALLSALAIPTLAMADQLADIKAAGVLRIAVIDQNPPFGLIDAKTNETIGYDVDFGKAIADKIGVKLQVVGTNPANRIPLLQSGKVDLIVADLTNTAERAKVVDFSYNYFLSGQQLLVPAKGTDKLKDYANKRIGAVKGTTGETQIKALFPKATVISYDDLPPGFAALRAGTIDAFTQDGSVLAPALANAPDKAKYKILPDFVSTEPIGIGVKQGEKAVLDLVNATLLELEANGNAAKIYDKWFGSGAAVPAPRNFKITKAAK